MDKISITRWKKAKYPVKTKIKDEGKLEKGKSKKRKDLKLLKNKTNKDHAWCAGTLNRRVCGTANRGLESVLGVSPLSP